MVGSSKAGAQPVAGGWQSFAEASKELGTAGNAFHDELEDEEALPALSTLNP